MPNYNGQIRKRPEGELEDVAIFSSSRNSVSGRENKSKLKFYFVTSAIAISLLGLSVGFISSNSNSQNQEITNQDVGVNSEFDGGIIATATAIPKITSTLAPEFSGRYVCTDVQSGKNVLSTLEQLSKEALSPEAEEKPKTNVFIFHKGLHEDDKVVHDYSFNDIYFNKINDPSINIVYPGDLVCRGVPEPKSLNMLFRRPDIKSLLSGDQIKSILSGHGVQTNPQ